MKDLSKKIYYLQGYSEALNLGDTSKEGKVLELIIDVLSDINKKIEELDVNQNEIIEFIENLDEESSDINNLLLENGLIDVDSNENLELDCPICKTVFTIKEHDLYTEEEVVCPECNVTVLSEETNSSFEKICEEIYNKLYDDVELNDSIVDIN